MTDRNPDARWFSSGISKKGNIINPNIKSQAFYVTISFLKKQYI